MMILLRYWKPQVVWRLVRATTNIGFESQLFGGSGNPGVVAIHHHDALHYRWGLDPVKGALNSIGILKFEIPGLNLINKADGTPLAIKPFELNYLSAPGTALLFTSIIAIPLLGVTYSEAVKIYWATLKQLWFSIVTIACVVGFAFIANYSGMSIAMAVALASTGVLFPFFSPILGWLGVFLTGSDTSSNALFCKLQYSSAESLGVDPVVTVSANASGGVTGKMISPQSIAIGAAAVGLVGKESDLFRFTVKHSFIMLFIICLLTFAQAYLIPWIVPGYKKLETAVAIEAANISTGFFYLLILALILAIVTATVVLIDKRKIRTS